MWKNAERVAKEERDQARTAENAAVASEADTEVFTTFLVNDVLSTARPDGWEGGLGVDVTVRRALDKAASTLDERFRGRPRAEAVARHSLGKTYVILGEPAAAEAHLRRAVDLRRQVLGFDHPDTVHARHQLAESLLGQAKREEAAELLKQVQDYWQRKNGPDHRFALVASQTLGRCYSEMGRHNDAIRLLKDTLRRSSEEYGPEDQRTLGAMNVLGAAFVAADGPMRHCRCIRRYFASQVRSVIITAHAHGDAQSCGRFRRRPMRDAVNLFEMELKEAKVKLDQNITILSRP